MDLTSFRNEAGRLLCMGTGRVTGRWGTAGSTAHLIQQVQEGHFRSGIGQDDLSHHLLPVLQDHAHCLVAIQQDFTHRLPEGEALRADIAWSGLDAAWSTHSLSDQGGTQRLGCPCNCPGHPSHPALHVGPHIAQSLQLSHDMVQEHIPCGAGSDMGVTRSDMGVTRSDKE